MSANQGVKTGSQTSAWIGGPTGDALLAMVKALKPYLIVFVASACGLVLEIVAGRLLAPSIGVSIYTWTAIIGVVLAGISVGSLVGGVVADRFPSPTTLGLILLAGGASSLSVLPLLSVASDVFWSLPGLARIVFMTGSLFFVPSLILGMVTPLVIKLHLRDLADTGKVVGRIYALSAAGSIFGTFLTGFVLIQWVGSRHTLILIAVTLVFLALLFGNLQRTKRLTLASLAVLIGLGATGFTSGAYDTNCTRESNYYCLRVSDAIVEGRSVKVLLLGRLVHSVVAVEDPTYLNYDYEKVFGELSALVAERDPSPRVLIIGGGGYVLPRFLEEVYPQTVVDVIEIDREVTQIAFDYLGLSPDTRIKTYNEDARMVVPKLPEGKYSLVVGDAFHDISVPYHLTTREFNEDVRALLNGDGIYAVNVIDKLHSGNFLGAFVKTLQQTFEYVYIMQAAPQWESDLKHTYVVVGSLNPLSPADLDTAAIQGGDGQAVSRIMPQIAFDSWLASQDDILLTDDHAPVDNLLAPIYFASSGLNRSEQHYNAGAAFQVRGRLDEAKAEYDKAIRLDPSSVLAYYYRGQVLSEMGQVERAIQDFDEAIGLDPDFAPAYIKRGIAYGGLGRHQQSLQDFSEAIRIDSGSVLAYRNRGTTYLTLGQFSHAIQDFDDAIELNPQDAAIHNNRGNAYLYLRDFQLAIANYDDAIRLNPEDVGAYNNRGTANVNLGQFRLAVQDYDEALRLDPQFGQAYNNRGTAHRRLGQYSKAIEDFGEAIRLNPGDAIAYANRALTFTHLNLNRQANVDMEQAVQAGFPRDLLDLEIGKIKAQR